MHIRRLKRLSPAGFGHFEAILAIIVIAGIAFAGVRILTMSSADTNLASSDSSNGFSVVGNAIIGPDGERWTNYGFVLECLAYKNPASACQSGGASGFTDLDKIRATANYWNGNAVRLQVAPENLFRSDGSANQQFVGLMDNEVNVANSLGLTVVLTLQEEEYGGPTFPTLNAIKFWSWMANHYKGYPKVMFDLYNEPALQPSVAGSEDQMWNIWQDGGMAGSVSYVGFQALVNTVRSQGANNVVIAESNLWDSDLSELSTHYLSGKNIAYGVETNLYRDSRDEQSWYTNFGQYAKDVPIMSEAFRDNAGNTCDPASPSDVPLLFDYLDSLHMGVFYWTLEAGLATQYGSITDPTSYAGHSSIACPSNIGNINPHNSVGPGADLLKFFTDDTSATNG